MKSKDNDKKNVIKRLDINSGVEKSPGVKDHEKIKSMISILKNIEVPNGFNFT